jgi:hypothetical protein
VSRGLLLLLVLACLGCGGGSTQLLLELWAGELPEVQQLRLSGRWPDGTLAFGPLVRPELARGALEDPQTLRVLLPSSAQGAVHVRAEGLVEGELKGWVEGTAQLLPGEQTRLALALARQAPACGACAGCCNAEVCVGRSLLACGAGGVSCVACDTVLADRCSSEGRCACGNGPACAPHLGSDRCLNGGCRCGSGSACAAGQRCDNGVCRCTADSCTGCCIENTCVPGTSVEACGLDGSACRTCAPGEKCQWGGCVT